METKYVKISKIVKEKDCNKYMELIQMSFYITSTLLDADGEEINVNGEIIKYYKEFNMFDCSMIPKYIIEMDKNVSKNFYYKHVIAYEPN